MTTIDPDLAEFIRRPGRLTCGIHKALEALKPAERRKLEKALAASPDIVHHPDIVTWLKAHGIDASGHAVGRHRRGDCSCEKLAKS